VHLREANERSADGVHPSDRYNLARNREVGICLGGLQQAQEYDAAFSQQASQLNAFRFIFIPLENSLLDKKIFRGVPP
jgi:hypothetical protein